MVSGLTVVIVVSARRSDWLVGHPDTIRCANDHFRVARQSLTLRVTPTSRLTAGPLVAASRCKHKYLHGQKPIVAEIGEETLGESWREPQANHGETEISPSVAPSLLI